MSESPQTSRSELERRVEELTRELGEALERQKASAEVLHVISASLTEVQPVFDAIVASGARLFGGTVALRLVRGDKVVRVATALGPDWPAWADDDLREVPIDHSRVSGRAILTRQVVHVPDIEAEGWASAQLRESARRRGFRALVAAPIMLGETAIGTIVVMRRTPGPFSEAQLGLVATFADQAVIAIENVRLFNELRDKGRQLERQAAELAEWNRTLEARVADSVAQLDRVARLKRFLTPQVVDVVLSGGGSELLKHHRREIVVVFLDLRGFTAFTETADPEEVMSVLNEYYGRMGTHITAQGGTLDKYSGDGIMVFFNDPIPVPDAADRAVRMALDMRADFAGLATAWKRRGYDLKLGIGIAQGYATLGTIGFEGRWDYGAIGTVCNLASRLCDEARGGEILISQRVLASISGALAAEPHGELTLKGFQRPVPAFSLEAEPAPG